MARTSSEGGGRREVEVGWKKLSGGASTGKSASISLALLPWVLGQKLLLRRRRGRRWTDLPTEKTSVVHTGQSVASNAGAARIVCKKDGHRSA